MEERDLNTINDIKKTLLREISSLQKEIFHLTDEISVFTHQVSLAQSVVLPIHKKCNELFNSGKAQAAVDALISEDVEFKNEKYLARYLWKANLCKKNLGIYLTHPKNINLFKEFALHIDLSSTFIIDGLRLFFKSFQLDMPEYQTLDRCCEAFAFSYHKQNPSIFISNEACHNFSIMTVFLSTTLHNPNVAIPLTARAFEEIPVSLCNPDMAINFRGDVYNNVKYSPIQPEDSCLGSVFHTIRKEGFLHVQNSKKNWKKRWCVISPGVFLYFKSSSKYTCGPKGVILLKDVEIKDSVNVNKQFLISVGWKTEPPVGSKKLANEQECLLLASSEREQNDWVVELRKNNLKKDSVFCQNASIDHLNDL